jgi:hypothetical protein
LIIRRKRYGGAKIIHLKEMGPKERKKGVFVSILAKSREKNQNSKNLSKIKGL